MTLPTDGNGGPAGLPAEPSITGAPAEPLLTVGTLATIAVAVLAALVAFGVRITEDQRTAVLAVIAAVAPLATAVLGRSQVYSPRSVARMLAAARLRSGPTL